MKNPDRGFVGMLALGAAAAALSLGIVTATVTAPAVAQAKKTFQVVLTNNATGLSHPWAKKEYDTQDACERAIRGINDSLRAIADPDPKNIPQEPDRADPELVNSVKVVMGFILANTGKTPDLSIACRLRGVVDA